MGRSPVKVGCLREAPRDGRGSQDPADEREEGEASEGDLQPPMHDRQAPNSRSDPLAAAGPEGIGDLKPKVAVEDEDIDKLPGPQHSASET